MQSLGYILRVVVYIKYVRMIRMIHVVFSHQLIATMPSVVTGQAPITLERKITSGGKDTVAVAKTSDS